MAPSDRIAAPAIVEVEVWSDIVCPWCYIGKRRFERAVEMLAGEVEVRVGYRPYQLDPRAPLGPGTPVAEAYAAKFGGPRQAAEIIDHVSRVAADEGLGFRMDRALRANTLAAHRLLWLTSATGHQATLKERLLSAYFCEGVDIGDLDALADLAADVGLERDRVRAFLDSDDGVAEVGAALQSAGDAGINAVPAYVIDGRWVVPGAQDPDTFVAVIRRLVARRDAS